MWRSIALSLLCGGCGFLFSLEINTQLHNHGFNFDIGVAGTIVVFSVLLFALSLSLGPVVQRWGGARGF